MSNKPQNITIAYAEDHALVRKAISDYIKSFTGIEMVADVSNGRELLETLNSKSAVPDICILDLFMPEMNGMETLSVVKRTWPELKVLILTAQATDYYMPQLLRAGANGYLLKDCDPVELETAIRSIYLNGIYSPDIVAYKSYRSIMNKEYKLPVFTDMEISVLKYCCSDLSYSQIAGELQTTLHSVDWHRLTLFKKLNVKSRSGLVMYAIRFGLIELNIDATCHSVTKKYSRQA